MRKLFSNIATNEKQFLNNSYSFQKKKQCGSVNVPTSDKNEQERDCCRVEHTAQHCRLGLFQDARHCQIEELKQKNFMFGLNSWMCKKQPLVSCSSTESEIISLDVGLRMDGSVVHDLRDIATESVPAHVQLTTRPNPNTREFLIPKPRHNIPQEDMRLISGVKWIVYLPLFVWYQMFFLGATVCEGGAYFGMLLGGYNFFFRGHIFSGGSFFFLGHNFFRGHKKLFFFRDTRGFFSEHKRFFFRDTQKHHKNYMKKN